jgi:leucyl aminopeptidase
LIKKSIVIQSVATGKYHAAVLTNQESWEKRLVEAGLSSGDLTFPIPFCPEFHFNEFASAVADMKNSVAVSFFFFFFFYCGGILNYYLF